MDIVIYMNKEDFYHKVTAYDCYWSMMRIPRNFSLGDKVFFATRGHVLGYVTPFEFNAEDVGGETIVWDGPDFVYINSIPCKQFRGFKYRKFEYEIENIRAK